MPTYEYKCKRCSYDFEAFQSIVAEPIKKCPRCKDGEVVRLIFGGAGLIFKGTGFYETDYKKKSGGNGNKYHGKKVETSKDRKTEKKTAETAVNSKN